MAEYTPVGDPMNSSEREGIRLLRDELLDHFHVVGNFELQLPNRTNTLEYDAVVIGEWGLYAVEIKGWGGTIEGDKRHWYLDWGRVDNPFILIEQKAKALRDLLFYEVEAYPRNLNCQSVVLLPRKDADVREMKDDRTDRLVQRGGVWDFFVGRHVEEGPGPIRGAELRQSMVEAILPRAEPGPTGPQVPNYEVTEEIDRGERPYREYIGRHEMLKSRGDVRIKVYAMDPLQDSEARDMAYARSLRDLEALSQLEDNEYIVRAYDMFRDSDDELLFYVVSEWVGPKTLRDWIERDPEVADDCEPMELVLHMIRAVASIHREGIVHRNLHPEVFYLAPERDVPLLLADFDYARMASLTSIAEGMTGVGTEGYVAPELWRKESHDRRADVYSLGVVIFEIVTGAPLYEGLGDMLDFEGTWQSKRDRIEPESLCRAMDRMLAPDPDERCTDLEDVYEVFESHVG
jgi:serine/threonine protein kinase